MLKRFSNPAHRTDIGFRQSPAHARKDTAPGTKATPGASISPGWGRRLGDRHSLRQPQFRERICRTWQVSDKEGKRLIIAAELLDQEPLVLKLGKDNQVTRPSGT